MKTLFFSIFALLLSLSSCYSQGYYNNWYFGTNAGITFNGDVPVALSDGKTNHLEGTACMSDINGNLLFYTDGVSVWNKNHSLMPNGTGLMGNWSSAQSALIVPMPGNATKYYIFTVTDWMNNGDLRYSVLDMTLSGGLGDIIPAKKNIFLATSQTEKLVSAGATGCGIWVITHQRNNNRFEARLITGNGIGVAVFSEAGAVHYSVPVSPDNYNALTGVMKVSKNNKKIAVATLSQINQLFDFDATNGQVTNPINLAIVYPNEGYGICFSPDNTKVYATEGSSGSPGFNIYQFDISTNDASIIGNSKVLVGRATLPANIVGDMQIGPDNKIYLAKQGTSYLAIIPQPNLSAPACGFVNNGIFLGGKLSNSGLPNETRMGSERPLALDLGKDTVLCAGKSLTLTAPKADMYLWSTGAVKPSETIVSPGKYWLQISNGECTVSDTILVMLNLDSVHLRADTTLCEGNILLLSAGKGFVSYLWQDGSVDSIYRVVKPGIYHVLTTNNCGVESKDTVVIRLQLEKIDLGPDRSKCNEDTLQLNAPPGFLNYLWSDVYNTNSTTAQSIVVNPLTDTAYYIKAEKTPGCFAYDTIRIKVNTSPMISFGGDKSFCSGDSVLLDAGTGFNEYVWNTGNTSQKIAVKQTGTYSVTGISTQGCKSFDTVSVVNVFPNPVVSLHQNSTLCMGASQILDAGNFSAYLWNDGSTQQKIWVHTTGSYSVEVIDNNGCKGRDTAIITTLIPLPKDFLPPDTLLCTYDKMTLAARQTYDTYQWSTGSMASTLTLSQPGIYWLKVKDANGCIGLDSIIISPKNCKKGIYVPTAFTPDHDGKNDVFRPLVFGNIKKFGFTIYNRWGQIVFQTTEVTKAWDGTIAGLVQDSNVFVWICTYQFEGEEMKTEKGTAVLIR